MTPPPNRAAGRRPARLATLIPIVLAPLAACAPLPAPGSANAAPLSQARQVQDECRADADRILARRDRGEFIRREEQESRLGAGAYAGPVTEIDRLAATWDRNRMAAACVRGRGEGQEVAPGPLPTAPGAAPAATSPRALPPPGVAPRPGS